MEDILKVEKLKVDLDNKPILKDIDLVIKKNNITAIIGPSGCGKSTLLKTINRIIDEEKSASIKGNIIFNNNNIKDITLEELRKSIGCVFQMPSPFPFSIYKNMTYALKYYGIKDKKILKDIVEEKLKMVGLYEEVKGSLNISALKLSGGQQQRLCIARTLTVEPEIILMDEPCSALDLNNTMKIEEMLKELKKKYTIVIVTHNLAQAKRIADYTAFIMDGNLIEFGRTDNIFLSPEKSSTREYVSGLFG